MPCRQIYCFDLPLRCAPRASTCRTSQPPWLLTFEPLPDPVSQNIHRREPTACSSWPWSMALLRVWVCKPRFAGDSGLFQILNRVCLQGLAFHKEYEGQHTVADSSSVIATIAVNVMLAGTSITDNLAVAEDEYAEGRKHTAKNS